MEPTYLGSGLVSLVTGVKHDARESLSGTYGFGHSTGTTMSNTGENVQQSFTNFMRKKILCPFCKESFADLEKTIRAHLSDRHAEFLTEKDNAVKEFRRIA